MAEQDNKQIGRRQFMRIAGVSVVGASLTGLAACSGGDSTSSAPEPAAPPPKPAAPAPTAAAPKPAPAPAPAPAAAVAKVAETDAQAAALGYKHNAAEVDLTKYPKRGEAAAANHYCKNCILYSGKDGEEWGPCSIFGGKLVNADGWCATYAPKAG